MMTNVGAQEGGREAAEFYLDTFRGEVQMDLEWLLVRYRHDASGRDWTPASWLVYRDAAVERWSELRGSSVTGETLLDRQRVATISMPPFTPDRTVKIPLWTMDDAVAEVESRRVARQAEEERLRTAARGGRRDSDLPPF